MRSNMFEKEQTLEEFIDEFVIEIKEIVPNYNPYKGVSKQSFISWLRRKMYIEFSKRLKQQEHLEEFNKDFAVSDANSKIQ